ncbi:MAG: histidinol dehydrogenase [Chitinophagaceae bacterium]
MKLVQYPDRNEWTALLQRPVFDAAVLEKKVHKILDKVKKDGDKAVRKFTKAFDGVKVKQPVVTEKEMENAVSRLPGELKQAILTAKDNIRQFHTAQLSTPDVIETMPGVQCWRRSVAIEKVGLYIPGGTAPLFSSVLMLGIPAKLAGCKEIVLCTPPQQDGTVHPAILFAAREVGITKIIKAGGVQAIGAMAYGTESVPQVYKIFGPGNQYVNCAKQLVQSAGIAIDMPAGPSEVCVLADETANPAFIAADLLSQAEHGPDSQVLLVSTDLSLIEKTRAGLDKQVKALPREKTALQALDNSKALLVKNMDEAIAIVNEYAPEHLIVCCRDEDAVAGRVVNAGSVFLGHYSPESVGDYASGTNHTLPTNGYAKSYSGVSLDSFVKKITYQKLTKEGLMNIGQTVITMAEAEGLQAHARAISVRLDQINNQS